MNLEQNGAAAAPLVTIVVPAYNHLDYTRLCIQALLEHTGGIPYRLILINNGSSDGTEEFFCGIPGAVKLSFPENIGVDKAVNWGFRMAEGKYTLNLSNDIVVTHRWLENLVACMESDETIGMAVPVCGVSSNNQAVSLSYGSLEEMQRAAADYNVSNPNLWEDRIKLVTYACLFRTKLQKEMGGFDEAYNPGAYDDDDISFRIRRAGYRLVLVGDTYVHHFGSVTFNAEYAKSNLAPRNLRLFRSKFGVHPWQAAYIDFNVLNLFTFMQRDSCSLLGIGSSCGSTLLQMKNACRSKGCAAIRLDYLSERAENMPELKSVCTECVRAGPGELESCFGERRYDYLLIESETDRMENPEQVFRTAAGLLAPGGQLVYTAAGEALHGRLRSALREAGLVERRNLRDYYFLNVKPLTDYRL